MPKKISLVLGLALVLVLVSATAAYAAAVSGYAAWSAGGPNATTDPTPHKDYITTSVKCAVCHAVHKAAPGGELLLRGTAGESCEFCHIADNIGLVRIYNGDVDNYLFAGGAQAHTDNAAGAAVGSRCVDCHAVHGAGTLDDVSINKYVLKATASASGAPGGFATPQVTAMARATANPGVKQIWVDAFCSMCHPYYQPAYNGQITVAAYHASGPTQSGTFQSHIMGPANANYANPRATYTGQVAWLPSTNCRSCHDAGLTDQEGVAPPSSLVLNSYPHFTPDYTRFMTAKAYSTDPAAGTQNYAAPSGDGVDYNSDAMPDGLCLKCHRSTGPATGIGYDF